MPLNSQYKEKYTSRRIRIDMVRERSINATLGAETDNPRLVIIPRSAISYASQKSFGRIMTFPVTMTIDIADWLIRKENL